MKFVLLVSIDGYDAILKAIEYRQELPSHGKRDLSS
jgi:hypothetical protein